MSSKRQKARSLSTGELPEHLNFKYLKKFILFPKLPVEVRLMIWRLAFPPPRRIDISERYPYYWWHSETPSDVVIPPSCLRNKNDPHNEDNLPVTLSVNRESRQETLKHYDVVPIRNPRPSPHRCPPGSGKLRVPLCVRNGVDGDTLAFFPRIMKKGEDEQWLNHIQTHAPKLLSSVENLEIDTGCPELPWSSQDLFSIFRSVKHLSLSVCSVSYVLGTPFSRSLQDRWERRIRDHLSDWIKEGNTKSERKLPVRMISLYDYEAKEPPQFSSEGGQAEVLDNGIVLRWVY